MTNTFSSDEKKEPWRFGGLLLLIGFGVLLSPLRMLNNLWLTYSPIFSDGTMEDIMMNASLGFKSIILIEIAVNISLFILSIYLIKLLLKKKSIFPKWYLIFAACTLLFLLLDTAILSFMFPKMEVLTTDVISGLAGSALAICAWSPYLFKSERSKNTFIQ